MEQCTCQRQPTLTETVPSSTMALTEIWNTKHFLVDNLGDCDKEDVFEGLTYDVTMYIV